MRIGRPRRLRRFGFPSVLFLICFSILSFPVSAEDAGEAGNGLIVSLSGEVMVHRSDGETAAVEGFALHEGDTVVVKMGGACRGFTPLGECFDLSGPAELALAPAAGETALSAVSSWIRRQITQWVGEAHRQPLTTRSVRDWEYVLDAPKPLLPAPGGSVRPGDARLRWGSLPGVESYAVTVAPEKGDEIHRTARGHDLLLQDLTPGAEYVWKVGPSAEGLRTESRWRAFRVLTPEEEADLNRALERLDPVDAGVLLLSVGLYGEAILRFDAAVSSEESGRSARLWRARAFADVGLYKEAYEDLLLAQEERGK
jgi:hypothetical protein